MNISKAARRGISIFSRIQLLKPGHLVPKLTPQEKATKMNERLDKEKVAKERRTKR